MIPKKPAPHLMRGVDRFSDKIMRRQIAAGIDDSFDSCSTRGRRLCDCPLVAARKKLSRTRGQIRDQSGA
jgi:hypothetical protein